MRDQWVPRTLRRIVSIKLSTLRVMSEFSRINPDALFVALVHGSNKEIIRNLVARVGMPDLWSVAFTLSYRDFSRPIFERMICKRPDN